MEAKQFRYQTFRLSFASGKAADSLTEDFLRLDAGFNKLVGVSVMEVANGGIANNYQVGIRNPRKQIIDPVNIQHFSAAYVSPKDKFLPVNQEYADGERIYISVTNQALTTATLTVDLTCWLELDLTEQPK